MRFGCIVTKLKSTFDSLIFESTAKADKCAIGIVSRCRCNIFAVGNRFANRPFRVSASSIRKFLTFSPLNSVTAEYEPGFRVISHWGSGLSCREFRSTYTLTLVFLNCKKRSCCLRNRYG